jgi:hypothetical protein
MLTAALAICARERCDNYSRINTGNGGTKLDLDQSCTNENNYSILEFRNHARNVLAGSLSGTICLFMAAIIFFIYKCYWPKHKLATRPCGFCLTPRISKRMSMMPMTNNDQNNFAIPQQQFLPVQQQQFQPQRQMVAPASLPSVSMIQALPPNDVYMRPQQEETLGRVDTLRVRESRAQVEPEMHAPRMAM